MHDIASKFPDLIWIQITWAESGHGMGRKACCCFTDWYKYLDAGALWEGNDDVSLVSHTRNLCSAFNPSKCTHTAVNTHTPWTHTRSSGQPFMLWRPGSIWGFGALLKGTSVVVLSVGESAGHSLPPPTIPAGPETRTHVLWVKSPTLYPLGHDCPWPNR